MQAHKDLKRKTSFQTKKHRTNPVSSTENPQPDDFHEEEALSVDDMFAPDGETTRVEVTEMPEMTPSPIELMVVNDENPSPHLDIPKSEVIHLDECCLNNRGMQVCCLFMYRGCMLLLLIIVIILLGT